MNIDKANIKDMPITDLRFRLSLDEVKNDKELYESIKNEIDRRLEEGHRAAEARKWGPKKKIIVGILLVVIAGSIKVEERVVVHFDRDGNVNAKGSRTDISFGLPLVYYFKD